MRAQAGHVARASHVQVHGPPEPRMRRAACVVGARMCVWGSHLPCRLGMGLFHVMDRPWEAFDARGGCYGAVLI